MAQMKSPALLCFAATISLAAVVLPSLSHAFGPKRASPQEFLTEASKENGLGEASATPWHVLAQFEVFDEDGKHKEGGTFEEWWFGPKSFKTVLKTDRLTQTDVATAQGLFRSGDAQWPNADEGSVGRLLSSPVEVFAPDQKRFDLIDGTRGKGDMEMRCISFNPQHAPDQHISTDAQIDLDALPNVCFAKQTPIMRVTFGGMRSRRVAIFDNIQAFHSQFVARDVRVSRAGKPHLDLHVVKLDDLPSSATAPQPEPGSKGPLTGPVQLPDGQLQIVAGEREQLQAVGGAIPPDGDVHVVLKVAVDAQGKVMDVAVVSGPPEFSRLVAQTTRRLRFRPFTILGTPVEADEVLDQDFGSEAFSFLRGGGGRR